MSLSAKFGAAALEAAMWEWDQASDHLQHVLSTSARAANDEEEKIIFTPEEEAHFAEDDLKFAFEKAQGIPGLCIGADVFVKAPLSVPVAFNDDRDFAIPPIPVSIESGYGATPDANGVHVLQSQLSDLYVGDKTSTVSAVVDAVYNVGYKVDAGFLAAYEVAKSLPAGTLVRGAGFTAAVSLAATTPYFTHGHHHTTHTVGMNDGPVATQTVTFKHSAPIVQATPNVAEPRMPIKAAPAAIPAAHDDLKDMALSAQAKAINDSGLFHLSDLFSQEKKDSETYISRIVNNPKLVEDIFLVSRINRFDPVELVQLIAAETSGDPAQFGNNKDGSAKTPLQITQPQFIQLLGKFGKSYAQNMRAYADQDAGHATEMMANAKELEQITQYIKCSVDGVHYRIDYKAYLKQHSGHVGNDLHKRIDALWANYRVSMGMQMISNLHDRDILKAHLHQATGLSFNNIDERYGHVLLRTLNYMGITRAKEMLEKIIEGHGNQKVVGNLMSAHTAKINFSLAPLTPFERAMQKAHIPLKNRVTYKTETIAYKFKVQIEPWGQKYSYMRNAWNHYFPGQSVASSTRPMLVRVAMNYAPRT